MGDAYNDKAVRQARFIHTDQQLAAKTNASKTQLHQMPKRRLHSSSSLSRGGNSNFAADFHHSYTPHQCNFSPTSHRLVNRIGHSSLSTSPNNNSNCSNTSLQKQSMGIGQGGRHPTSGKQFQTGNKQFFTMSASIPAHHRHHSQQQFQQLQHQR